jgi:6-pyruvoyltetrahydropterin/6-carboxytetrahydropterin synthase
MKKRFISTKTFDNYSVALRQHKAQHSHCKLLHGYALEFKVWFASIENEEENQLDEMGWITDYGLFSRNGLKEWLNHMFDHTTLIEKDDPQLESFQYLEELGLCDLRIMDKMGAESLAKLVFDKFTDVFSKTEGGRVKIVRVECWENKNNSSIYELS